MNSSEILAANIKKLMRKHALTTPQLADQTGIPYTTLLGWLKGTNYPRQKSIEKLAEFFKVNPGDLVTAPQYKHYIRKLNIQKFNTQNGKTMIQIDKLEDDDTFLGKSRTFWQIAQLVDNLDSANQKKALNVLRVMFPHADTNDTRTTSNEHPDD